MSLIYVHGVKVRSREHGEQLERPFQRWIAPVIAGDGKATKYLPVFWGDLASKFRWDLDSRPRTRLLRGGGGSAFDNLGVIRTDEGKVRPPSEPFSGGGPVLDRPRQRTEAETGAPLSSIPAGHRADFLAQLYLAARPAGDGEDPLAETPLLGAIAAAADDVAGEWEVIMAKSPSDAERAADLVGAVDAALRKQPADLVAQGGLPDWMGRAGELLGRAVNLPGDAIGTALGELRPVAHEFIANFIGDVFVYLNGRTTSDGQPGGIPRRMLEALRAAHRDKQTTGERIVIISHSMGGQIVYDALTAFCDADDELRDLVVDHWITCGSQVSLFAELGLFRGQPADVHKPVKLPRPPRVLQWTNYYDTNDLVGFIMQPVFEDVADEPYDTGFGLALAHTGFFARESFFRKVAKALGAPP